MKRGLKRQHIVLKDGRTLSYVLDRTNDTDRSWIFSFHGMFSKADDLIHNKPLSHWNCVYMDRPGYGQSDPAKDADAWTYLHFAHDVEQLADTLEIQQYYVAGHSSGGPCALACGAHSSDRVLGIASIAGDPEYASDGAPKEVPVLDCLVYRCLGPGLVWCLSFGNTCGFFAGRLHGAYPDYVVERKPYDFVTESISVPTLFYHGRSDTDIRPEYSAFTHSRISGSELIMVDGADHTNIISHGNLERALARIAEMVKSSSGKGAGGDVGEKVADEGKQD